MPFYLSRGSIPGKRHIQHYYHDKLCYEEHISREGFSDIYSNMYHIHPPTQITKMGAFTPIIPSLKKEKVHRHHLFDFNKIESAGNWVNHRTLLLYNNDVRMSMAVPLENPDFYYRNSSADEVIFVHHGHGVLESSFGHMEFKEGDYIVIPLGALHRLYFKSNDTRLLIIESGGCVTFPKRYRNQHGQLLEHAPFCERDVRVPEFIEPVDQAGIFDIVVRLEDGLQEYQLAHHPFDLVGWDGYYYPWIFNIDDFMPITGKVHQPPPVHQTFEGPGFVICSFVPRLFDYHDQAIPAPYAHSNVESDEVIYYVKGNFMSRRSVGVGSATLHPRGMPHGPQPGKYEGSIGKTKTDEVAVMLDTFKPLYITEEAMQCDIPQYPYSWLEEKS